MTSSVTLTSDLEEVSAISSDVGQDCPSVNKMCVRSRVIWLIFLTSIYRPCDFDLLTSNFPSTTGNPHKNDQATVFWCFDVATALT